ncbi:MAG: TetR/AcrR family transcriptional regulator [Betaproteobacteria bacterium]
MDATATGRSRGRPRAFDREQALERAMQVFWKQGYEGTSIQDLTAAMGINPPSLYAAFGDKEQLVLEAIARYEGKRDEIMALVEDAPSAREGVARLLRGAAAWLPQCGGCMLVLSAGACSEAAAKVQEKIAQRRCSQKERLKARIDRGLRDGDVPRGADSAALAEFYTTVLQGMSIRARDGATRKQLNAVAEAALGAWPQAKKKR